MMSRVLTLEFTNPEMPENREAADGLWHVAILFFFVYIVMCLLYEINRFALLKTS